MLYPKSTSFQSVIALSLHKYFLTVLGLMFFSFSMGWGQEEIAFRQFTEEDGLPGKVVYKVMQDSRGWIWICSDGLSRFDGQSFKKYKHDLKDPNSLITNTIYSIYEDGEGKIWIATLDGGLDKYDPETDQFTHYLFDENNPQSINSNTVYSIAEDKQGFLWVGTQKGLNRLDQKTGLFKRFEPNPDIDNSLSYGWPFSMITDSQGFLWIATGKGLNLFDPTTEKFVHFYHNPDNPRSLSNDALRYVYEDSKGQIWVGTQEDNVLNRFVPATQDFDHFQLNTQEETIHGIQAILEDSGGKIWVGAASGLYLLDEKNKAFDYFLPNPNEIPKATGSSNMILSLIQDEEGTFWLGTWGGGMFSFEDKEANYQQYNYDSSDVTGLSQAPITSVCKTSNDDFWIGTFRGLNHLDPVSKKFTTYMPNPNDLRQDYQNDNHIFNILEDQNQNIWVGTAEGLRRFDRHVEQFFHYSITGKKDIEAIYEDSKGQIWVSAIRAGLFRYDSTIDDLVPVGHNTEMPESFTAISEGENNSLWLGSYEGLYHLNLTNNRIKKYQRDLNDVKSLSGDAVMSMYKDSRGNLWIGTQIGLSLLHNSDPVTFEHFLEKDGLAGSIVLKIFEDAQGTLWLDTDKGISAFDQDTKTFRNFYFLNGQRIRSMVYLDQETDDLWLGTENGLIIIHPDSLPNNDYRPPVYISSLSTYQSQGKENGFQEMKAPWAKKTITLPYGQNTFSAEFAVLSYKKPTENEAAYKLEGVSEEWIPLGSKREATFSNLRPGNYTLRVKGSNNDGVWNEKGASLEITILPPWWLTFWAKLAYVLLAVGTLYNLYRFQLRRKLALAETKRLQELDAVKTKLFTNITHEFRTPLTVIRGMADHTIDQEGDLAPTKNLENAQLIKRNSAQLLTLVNQMLDLRKLESGALPLRMQQGDVIQYLRYLTESFHSHARNKEVGLHFLTEQKELVMDYDPEKLLYIVSNLLSNAIKFTPRDGNVYFGVKSLESRVESDNHHSEVLELSIKDTGVGIEVEKLPHIFDRFYQADDSVTRQGEGSGIGLALCRELVKLLGGEIKVSSELGQGSVFTVSLPITKEAEEKEIETVGMEEKVLGFAAPAALAIQTTSLNNGEDDLPLALIIEDNPDVIRYLNTCLEQDYKILTSMDGQTGIETAIDVIPDIIISDVMMPKKNGYEVCDILKNDERTSHIPIILLTAKADLDSRIKGLAGGADAYLAKPFHREELQVRLEQLIELRKKLQETYAGLEPSETSLGNASIENEFLRKIRQVVEEKMEDSEFGIVQLCRAIGLSRSQLFRKLKALTGKSASLVIRSIRLQRARKLLQTTDLNVSEVAYEVGFKDLAYFSKCFLEEYGETPSSVKAGYS